ncbi:ABC-2 transporter permease [Brevibacillus borstelensis]|uniref:ABC-2 transporter permease n=1 Tax=Brevibacillus borstelensis TaxID=45462 RepID=UPI0030C36508
MLNLLRKDFIALKSSLWMAILYLAVFSAFFIPKNSSLSIYLVGIYTAFGLLNLGVTIDIKNNNHHFLVTLPIKRKHIVQAKYIAAIIYTLFGVLASYGIHWLVKQAILELNMPDYSVLDILVPAGITLLLASVYLPLFYAFSKKGSSIIFALFLIIMIVLAQPIGMFINMVNESGFNSHQTLFLILTGIILLFIASYCLTIKLFTNKDL